ncbi:MAG TPA: macro domain-containing protein [Candidatus Limnocylindria bacterium]|nr:macro domain-containing protein [Candidatus Limnocylindria bacterium]
MAVPIEIDVWQGEIAELEVDAILVPANESLFMTAPVARALRLRAGEAVERDAVQQGPVEAGTAVVTGGGELAAPYVIHVVGVGHDLQPDAARLRRALDAGLELAARLGLARLAVAPVGVERGVFDPAAAASVLARVLTDRATFGAPLPASLVVAVSGPAEAVAYGSALAAMRATA